MLNSGHDVKLHGTESLSISGQNSVESRKIYGTSQQQIHLAGKIATDSQIALTSKGGISNEGFQAQSTIALMPQQEYKRTLNVEISRREIGRIMVI